MKNNRFFILIAVIFFGCSKSNNSVIPGKTIFPLAIARYYATNHLISYRNFNFDSSRHLVSIYRRQNDTLDVSTGYFEVDSGTYLFDLDPVTYIPKGYRSDYKKGYIGAQTYVETHLMYYNSQSQLIKDSGILNLPGQNPNPVTKYYTYSGTTTVCNSFLSGQPFTRDTIITSNGNIIYFSSNDTDGNGGWTNQLRSTVAYSSAQNPLYSTDLSNILGAFLLVERIDDFISINLFNNNGYSWINGSNGKVTSGSAPNGDYTTYSY
jgi:hypothetical protein